LPLVVDASVALKWVLQEPDSHLAEALVRVEPDLLIPDFWLGEATNVLWVQVRRKLLTGRRSRGAGFAAGADRAGADRRDGPE
jgi:predicted nucleic acid-binding protein